MVARADNVPDISVWQNAAVLIDKPLGWTSFDVCGKLRRVLEMKKVSTLVCIPRSFGKRVLMLFLCAMGFLFRIGMMPEEVLISYWFGMFACQDWGPSMIYQSFWVLLRLAANLCTSLGSLWQTKLFSAIAHKSMNCAFFLAEMSIFKIPYYQNNDLTFLSFLLIVYRDPISLVAIIDIFIVCVTIQSICNTVFKQRIFPDRACGYPGSCSNRVDDYLHWKRMQERGHICMPGEGIWRLWSQKCIYVSLLTCIAFIAWKSKGSKRAYAQYCTDFEVLASTPTALLLLNIWDEHSPSPILEMIWMYIKVFIEEFPEFGQRFLVASFHQGHYDLERAQPLWIQRWR